MLVDGIEEKNIFPELSLCSLQMIKSYPEDRYLGNMGGTPGPGGPLSRSEGPAPSLALSGCCFCWW